MNNDRRRLITDHCLLTSNFQLPTSTSVSWCSSRFFGRWRYGVSARGCDTRSKSDRRYTETGRDKCWGVGERGCRSWCARERACRRQGDRRRQCACIGRCGRVAGRQGDRRRVSDRRCERRRDKRSRCCKSIGGMHFTHRLRPSESTTILEMPILHAGKKFSTCRLMARAPNHNLRRVW